MSMKSSWRFSFTDVDASVVAKTAVQDEVLGFTSVRAPKGSKKAVYFGVGNEDAIKAYIGVPSSNWPDIYEAIDFNKRFPLYISASAGGTKSYPSYLGGKYLTKSGEFIDYVNVESIDDLDYTTSAKPTQVQAIFQNNLISSPSRDPLAETEYNIDNLETKQNVAFVITIPGDNFANVDQIQFKYFGSRTNGFDDGIYYYTLDKSSRKVYAQDENFDPITNCYAGIWCKSGSNIKIILGGSTWLKGQTNNFDTFGLSTEEKNLLGSLFDATSTNDKNYDNVPFLNANDLLLNIETLIKLKGVSGPDADAIYKAAIGSGNVIPSQAVTDFFGKSFTVGSGEDVALYEVPTQAEVQMSYAMATLIENVEYLENIKKDTLVTFNQRTQTEATTEIEISHIGYDKYLYDNCYKVIIDPRLGKNLDSQVIVEKFGSDKYIVVASEDLTDTTGSGDTVFADKEVTVKIYKTDSSKAKSTLMVDKAFEDVTELCVTKRIYIRDVYRNNFDAPEVNLNLTNKIVEVTDFGKIAVCTNHEDAKYKLVPDIKFNTITFKAKEDVNGQTIVDGPFTGSLDPLGVDAYGSNIFFPNVVLASDLHFVDVTVTDEDGFKNFVNPDNGIYNGNRLVSEIIDDVKTTLSFKLKGQRYITKTVQDNINQGVVGGVYTTAQESAVMDGWKDFRSVDYDPVYVAFDPIGIDSIQSEFAALRTLKTGQQFCTMLSNRRLNAKEAKEPAIINVKGRSEGCAQLINEIKFYDAQTGKYFYRTLTGPYASACATIMKNKLGGAAPACMNYDGMGGQLEYTGTALEAKWEFSEEQLKKLDEKGLNAITFDPAEGVMVTSQKTTLDPTNTSDRSYLAHTMAFDICKRNIRDLVMVPQLMKPIDEEWMNLRESQTQNILNRRLAGPTKIWAEGICKINDPKINNAQTKAERIFKIDVKVKVIPISEYVSLTFTNVAQDTSVTED